MRKPIILCVDDESIILNSLDEQLSRNLKNNFEIEVAESAEEALELFEELMKDVDIPVVISDYIMPGMKGDEFLKRIHALQPKTITILLTGQASIEGVSNAINHANLYRFIAKPWDQDDLRLTIKEAVKSFDKTNEIERHTKELEEKVKKRTKELQELNATKDRFFSIIAHDLKSPFSYLLGMTELLSESMDTMNPGKLKVFIMKLNDSAQSAFDLLENLLIWARTQQKMITMSQKAHNLKDMVNSSIKPLLNLALDKSIDLSIEINALENKIFVDEYMISTVIRNLVNNAIKFTKNNGAIRIFAEKNEEEVTISVNDSGVGMSKEIISKLFKIGENVSTSGTNNETGTGLGLILCQEFVTKNGGKIWVESQEGVGTTFFFTVPIENNKKN